jgi:hypothetical protein
MQKWNALQACSLPAGIPFKGLHHYLAAKCVEGIPRKLLNYLIINTLINSKNESN